LHITQRFRWEPFERRTGAEIDESSLQRRCHFEDQAMRRFPFAVATVFVIATRAAAQIYFPIPVTGYNQDVIADANGSTINNAYATTTTGFDNPGTGNMYV
jgi:hypothetical protein